MKRSLLQAACLAALALPLVPPHALARPFTAQDLVALDRLSDPQISPDGGAVAYSVRRTDLAADRGVSAVQLMSLSTPGSPPVALPAPACASSSPAALSSPRWAPDGRALYLLGGCGKAAQLWRAAIDPQGRPGVPVQITHLPVDILSFRVAPDGRHLVVAAAVFPDAEGGSADPLAATASRLAQRGKAKTSGVVYDKLFVRHWDAWADGTRNHLFALTLDAQGAVTGLPVALMPGFDGDVPSKPFGDETDFTITPDGRNVIFSAREAGRSEPWSTNFDLYQVAMAGGGVHDLTRANPAWDAGPVVSPDGRTLAYRAMKRPGFEADRFGVMVMDLASGRTRELDPHWDRSAESLLWSQDGRTLYVTAEENGSKPVFAMDATTGAATRLTQAGHVSDVQRAGHDLVIARDALDSPTQLWRLPAQGGDPVQLTHVGASQLAGVDWARFQQFAFPGWNGETVHGYVLWPSGYQPDHRYPVAFLIHGGPQGSFGDSWSYRWNPQFYAGLGYGVVMIDFHGSTGYGQGFTDAISGHWGDRPLEDLQKGWAYALAHYPFLDGGKACALGASYGGFMVNWIAGIWNAPWKCLVTHDGVFDDRMMGYATDELWFAEWEHGGPGHTPWQNPAAYERFNPADHVAAWRVPQLIIHGGRDYRIPIEQGLGAFDALQRKGIESKLLVFPDENHWVLKPGNALLWHATVAAWLKAHLG